MSPWLITGSIIAALLGALAGDLRWWSGAADAFRVSSPSLFLLSLGFALAALAFSRFRPASLAIRPELCALGLLGVYFSDWLTRSYNFYQGPSIRGEIALLGLAALWGLPRLKTSGWYALFAAIVVTLVACFVVHSGYNTLILYSDDNPSFLLRLSLLKKNFPLIPFYYPLWNAGMDARDFFATGALNIFFLAAPLIYSWDVPHIYNILVLGILFVVLPFSIWATAALSGHSHRARVIAAILALSCGLVWYRWGLKYGTLGFITTASLVPLNVALATKWLSPQQNFSRRDTWLLLAAFTLMLFWVLSGVVFLPMAALTLFLLCRSPRAFLQRPYLAFLVAGLLVLNVPWLTVLWKASKIHTFIAFDAGGHSPETQPSNPEPAFRHKDNGLSLKAATKVLRETAVSTNPLLFFLGIPGILLLRRFSRLTLGTTIAWLLFLGTFCVSLKPQLELDRMLLLMSLCLCVPAALSIETLIIMVRVQSAFAARIALWIAGGFFLTGPFCAGAVLLNRSVEHFYFAGDDLQATAQAISRHARGGRVLFSGFVLHEFNHGHLAPLSELSNTPLIASSPFHNKWRYEQVFPKSFIERGDSGIREYLDLMNVSAVFAHEREWREYFTERPGEYMRVWSGAGFVLFERIGFQSNYLLEGMGEVVAQTSNSLRVRADSSELTLKFTYFPFLASSDCHMSPQSVAPEVTFIHLSDCVPGTEVTIQSVAPWERVLQ